MSSQHQFMRKKEFKVLFVFPNIELYVLPLSIARLSSQLKAEGYSVDLYEAVCASKDVNFFKDQQDSFSQDKQTHTITGALFRYEAAFEGLIEKVESYQPDLIAMSLTELIFPFGISLLNAIEYYEITTIVGGVFPTFAPEKVLAYNSVNMVCIGEGDFALPELCRRMEKGVPYHKIPNLWIKQADGSIIRNPIAAATDINNLSPPDFDIFQNTKYYPPKGLFPLETDRGCPYHCAYCNSPVFNELYKVHTNKKYYRKRNMSSIRFDLEFLAKQGISYQLYFTSDTFLMWSHKEFDEFVELYSDYKIPFYCSTRPETISADRMSKLESIGLHHLSIGIEHGNEKFRREVIKRRISNDKIIKSINTASQYCSVVSVDNIVGFPGETPELALDTIRLNRQINAEIKKCFIFAPYHGTPLRQVALDKGYLKEDSICGRITQESMLNMPHFSKEQIWLMCQNFNRYVGCSNSDWSHVEKEISRWK
jgi:radical SAM superfamily enzyme YgiQ (UPF0313 family)